MSTDKGTGDQAYDDDREVAFPPSPAINGLAATLHRGLLDEEHRLVDEEHRLVDEEHRLVEEEHRLVDEEHRPVDERGEVLEKTREHLEEGRKHVHEELNELLELERRMATRVKVSTPGRIWTRLNAVDFMNSSMQFAALAILCLFPFLVIVAAEIGGDARPALIRRLGLDRAAAKDVNSLMSGGTHAAATLDVIGAAFVLLGAIGIASTLQAWYQRVYDQRSRTGWARQVLAQFIWVVGFVAYLALQDLIGRELARVGQRVLIYAAFFVVAVAFYWWTQHVLLRGRVGWRELFPAAVATGVCVTGPGAFSAFLFSGQLVSSDQDYGSIGVVTVLLSYLVGYGVCLHIGAVAGHVWNERHLPAPEKIGQPAAG